MPYPVQLEFQMTALLKHSDYSPESIERKYHFNKEQVIAFCEDTWTSVSRAELHAYFNLAKRHGVDFLTTPIHPAWETFDRPSLIFNSKGVDGDIRPIDLNAEAMLKEATGLTAPHFEGKVTRQAVIESMLSNNTILIGSPKYNQATDIALRYLWRLKATSPPPFKFLWTDWHTLNKRSLFADQSDKGGPTSLLIRSEGAEYTLPVVQKDREGMDFGLLVICRQPPAARKDVTTIILAGHSGFATADMAQDLAHGTVYIKRDLVKPGVPMVRLLAARWRKHGPERRRATKGRQWCGVDPQSLRRIIQKTKKRA
jgi:hypothetical protein